MKKTLFCAVCALLACFAVQTNGYAITNTTRSVYNYLKAEGYLPEFDNYGNVVFKVQGVTFVYVNNDEDDSFFQLIMLSMYAVDDSNRKSVLDAASEVAIYTKVVKVMIDDDSANIAFESLLDNTPNVSDIIPRAISLMFSALKIFYSALPAVYTHAGHGYVDMGLSVMWATCNVGADSPGEYGNYYAWGETIVKSNYSSLGCETWQKLVGNIGGTSRDVAHVKWGGSWRMPTKAEFDELLDEDNCTWEWTTLEGHYGYKVKSKKTGNSIFLPAAGYRSQTLLYGSDKCGYYWSSTVDEGIVFAYILCFYRQSIGKTDRYPRHDGLMIRPVVEF